MTLEQLLAEAAWLSHLTGQTPPGPIRTEDDLREFASDIELHCRDELTCQRLTRLEPTHLPSCNFAESSRRSD
jgi:hypothetical protein